MPPRQIGLKRFITQIIILAPIRLIHSYLSMQYTPLEKPNKSSARANLVSRVAKLISVSFRFIIGLLDCLLTAHYGAHQIPNFWYQILSVNFPATFLCKKREVCRQYLALKSGDLTSIIMSSEKNLYQARI